MGMTSFREVLEKMLVIVVLPVRKSLRKEVELFSPHLVSNTCGLLASIVSELTASALGSEVTSFTLPNTLSLIPESGYLLMALSFRYQNHFFLYFHAVVVSLLFCRFPGNLITVATTPISV